MEKYNPQKIEPKWQRAWEKSEIYRAQDFSKKPKKYILIEFPYPSGEGLHVGHCRSYSALDAVARKKRMEGFNVLFPIGWDAFGLPAENYAIKTGIHPQEATKKNIANYKRQLKSLGLSFDWNREINTTDPKYYKWTQRIFLKLFEQGLAYQAEIPINWCPSCKIGLANEEVISGKCERCGTQVEKKIKKQWMLRITKYADRLIDDLKKLDYLEKIKAQQINWIGRSCGTTVKFKIQNYKSQINSKATLRGVPNFVRSNKNQNSKQTFIEVFTTRADTIFGVTAVVLAPEHSLVEKLITDDNKEKVINYIEQSKKKSDFERTELRKEKTGVFTGSYCINPVNNEKIPIWVGDYIVATYGGGAVMVVPAHDKRDFDFAKKYKLLVKEVIISREQFSLMKSTRTVLPKLDESFTEDGVLINSGQFSGLSSKEAIEKITDWLEKKKLAKKTVHYKLRDWVFSRQHYWGEPIPVIHCEKCGAVPVLEKDLPVELPYVEKYQPTGTGESPLAKIKDWVNVKCPKCKGPAKRETDTMPNWAGSSWYFMRYTDPNNNKSLADSKKLKYWLPVDWYNGGMEHTTLHLLYSRFWYKFLFDIGIAPQAEPYIRRTSHGIVLAEDGRKMSKSFGNVVNPDDIIKEYGADTLRVYEMFMGPFGQAITWSTKGVKGVYRFLEKVWKLSLECSKNKKSSPKIIRAIHQLNNKIDEDLEATKFNTIIAGFMKFVNLSLENEKEVGKDTIEKMLILLSPFAPHICEELWQRLGNKKSIFKEKWPKYDQKLIKEEKIILIIQINGKVRDKIEVETNISEKGAKRLTLEREKVKRWIEGRTIKKIVFIKGKLLNIVI